MPVRCRSCGVRWKNKGTAGKVDGQRIEARRRVNEERVARILEDFHLRQLRALAREQRIPCLLYTSRCV